MIDLRASTDPDITVAGQVLAALDTPARLLGADCMVVGATARNILSVAWFGRLPSRATRDVDVAVAVATWEAFDRLTEGLTRQGAHTFSVLIGGSPVEVDVVPYGGIETPDRRVLLLDDHLLNVLGIREAFDAADVVHLPGDLMARVPTIPGLALLKIIAWSDRRSLSRRDATDLDEILGWYAEGPFLDDLYEDTGLLARYDFDLALVGARRLGRDLAAMAGEQARAGVLSILQESELRPVTGSHAAGGPLDPPPSSRLTQSCQARRWRGALVDPDEPWCPNCDARPAPNPPTTNAGPSPL